MRNARAMREMRKEHRAGAVNPRQKGKGNEMLESRSCYGYYGEGHGATGETPPDKMRGGYSIKEYRFVIDWHIRGIANEGIIHARNYKNAVKQAKAWAKRDGGEFIGDTPDGWNERMKKFDD